MPNSGRFDFLFIFPVPYTKNAYPCNSTNYIDIIHTLILDFKCI